jgi:hypothetical protein
MKKSSIALLFILAGIIIAYVPLQVFAQSAAGLKSAPVHLHPNHYLCKRTLVPVTIDGRLDDTVWSRAAWTSNFVDIEGSKRPLPRFRTRIKMLWDDSCLYIAAEVSDPHVWATLTKRDTVIFYDNDFEVFMDPDGDNCEYGEFEMNALNTVWDLFLPKPYKDGGSAVDSWNIDNMKSAVHVSGTINNPSDADTGWSAEIAFPWRSLARCAHRTTAPDVGNQWRINFSRVEWITDIIGGKYVKKPGLREDNWVWSPQDVVDMHRPEMWGILQFAGEDGAEGDFVPDAAIPAREYLMTLHYAEKAYFDRNKKWTDAASDLGLPEPVAPLSAREIALTPAGYRARVTIRLADGTSQVWSINEESRLSH